MTGSRARRPGRAASLALLAAAGFSVVLVAGAFAVPVYRSVTVSSSGQASAGSATLVGVNGLAAAGIAGVPLLATIAVGCALALAPGRYARPLAWALTGLMAAFNLLAMLSVGIFMLPVTAALIFACATARPTVSGPSRSAGVPPPAGAP